MARTPRTVRNYDALYAAGETLFNAGQHSIANPTCAVKDNPFCGPESDREMRAAVGSINAVWICTECDFCFPRMNPTDHTTTVCCNAPVYVR